MRFTWGAMYANVCPESIFGDANLLESAKVSIVMANVHFAHSCQLSFLQEGTAELVRRQRGLLVTFVGFYLRVTTSEVWIGDE
jgi:hypothetical protein